MAKIAFFVLFALVAIQLSTAGRIAREEPPKSPELPKTLDEFLQQVQSFVKENINQEQLDKLKAFGESLGAKGKELVDQASADFKKIGEKN